MRGPIFLPLRPIVPTLRCPKSPSPATLPLMRNLEQIHKALDRLPRQLSESPKEPPKGSFYDLSSDEDPGSDEESKTQVVAASPAIRTPASTASIQNTCPRNNFNSSTTPWQIRDLAPEIAIVRVRLNGLLNDPEASPDLINRTLKCLGQAHEHSTPLHLRITMSCKPPFVCPTFFETSPTPETSNALRHGTRFCKTSQSSTPEQS